MAAATVHLVEADLAGTVSQNGYALIFAAWILLLVAIGYDLVRILSRAILLVLGQRRTR